MSRPPGPLGHHFAAPQREDGQAAPLAPTLAIQRQAKTADQGTGAIAQSGAVNLMPQGSGRPLPKQVSDPFVQSGYPEVKQARVHVDDTATQSIQAKAYTQNNNIVVQSSGANDPKLLGHEATHVVQQSQMALKPDVNGTPINANPALEQNADDNGERVARHESVSVVGVNPQAATPGQGWAKLIQQKASQPFGNLNGIIQRKPTVNPKKNDITVLKRADVLKALCSPKRRGRLDQVELRGWLKRWWKNPETKGVWTLTEVYRLARKGGVSRVRDGDGQEWVRAAQGVEHQHQQPHDPVNQNANNGQQQNGLPAQEEDDVGQVNNVLNQEEQQQLQNENPNEVIVVDNAAVIDNGVDEKAEKAIELNEEEKVEIGDEKALNQNELKQHGHSQNTGYTNEDEKTEIDGLDDKEEKVRINDKKHNKKQGLDHRTYIYPKGKSEKTAGFADAKKKVSEAIKLAEMKAYLQHIPLRELGAINDYQGYDHQDMNKNLRKSDGKDPRVLQATSALNQLPPVKGTVYRGINADFSNLEAWGYLNVGGVHTEKTFVSTTIDRRNWAASSFSDGRTGFQIESEGGAKDIRGFARSNYEKEDELIFTPRTQFQIEGVTPWLEKITHDNKDKIPKKPTVKEKVTADELDEKLQAKAIVIYLHELPSKEQQEIYQELDEKYGTININKATKMSILMSAIEQDMYKNAGVTEQYIYGADEYSYLEKNSSPRGKIKHSFFVNVLSAIKQISQDSDLADEVISRLQAGSVGSLKELSSKDKKVETLLNRWETHMGIAKEFIQDPFGGKHKAIKDYNEAIDRLLNHKRVKGNKAVIDIVIKYLENNPSSELPVSQERKQIDDLLKSTLNKRVPAGPLNAVIRTFRKKVELKQ